MSALRPANTNTSPERFPQGADEPFCTARMRAGLGRGRIAPGNSCALVEEGPAPAGPLRPLIESLDRVLERLIDSRAQDAIEGRIPWTRPETPRPGERI
jgi:hypothetical protein